MIQAITRGREGLVGEDVTHTVKQFLNVPLSVPIYESFEVRGEGVISWKNFNEINSSLTEPYSHPRGLASGSTRKLDANEAKKRKLEFFAHKKTSLYLVTPFYKEVFILSNVWINPQSNVLQNYLYPYLIHCLSFQGFVCRSASF